MSSAPNPKPDNGTNLVAGGQPVPKYDRVKLALALEAVAEVNGMTFANRLALYEDILELQASLRAVYTPSLDIIKKSIVPPHVTWAHFARDLLRLEAALANDAMWLHKRPR